MRPSAFARLALLVAATAGCRTLPAPRRLGAPDEPPGSSSAVVQFAPDGTVLSTGHGAIRTFSSDGRAIATIASRRRWTSFRAALSPDGDRVAWLVDEEPALHVSCARTGRLLRTLACAPSGFDRALAFAPDGERVAMTGDGCLALLDLARGREEARVVLPLARARAVAFTPAGDRVLVAGGGLAVVDVATRRVARAPGAGLEAVSFALAPSGSLVAVGSTTGRVVFVPTPATGATLDDLEGDEPAWTALARGAWAPSSLAFTPDGARLVAVDDLGLLRTFDLLARTESATLLVPGVGTSLAVSPDGRHAALGGKNRSVLVDLEARTVVAHLERPRRAVERLVVGSERVVAIADGFFRVLDRATGRTLAAIDEPNLATAAAASGLVASTDARAAVVLRDDRGRVRTRLALELPGRRAWTAWPRPRVAVSGDGSRLATAGPDGRVHVWGLATKRRLGERDGAGGHVLELSPDGSLLLTESYHDAPPGTARVHVHLLDEGVERTFVVPGRAAHVVAASPDGRHVAAAGLDDDGAAWLVLFDVERGLERRRFSLDGAHAISGVALGDDRVATSDLGGAVRLYSLDGEELANLTGTSLEPIAAMAAGTGARSVAFSPDGATLGAGLDDGSVLLWDVRALR